MRWALRTVCIWITYIYLYSPVFCYDLYLIRFSKSGFFWTTKSYTGLPWFLLTKNSALTAFFLDIFDPWGYQFCSLSTGFALFVCHEHRVLDRLRFRLQLYTRFKHNMGLEAEIYLASDYWDLKVYEVLNARGHYIILTVTLLSNVLIDEQSQYHWYFYIFTAFCEALMATILDAHSIVRK